MKTDIHPIYYPDTQVTCACGNSFTTGSTKQKIHVEICAACHPFFTGEMKYVDTAGRVDRFKEKMASSQIGAYMKKKAKKVAKKEAQKAAWEAAPRTMREMMAQVKPEAGQAKKSSDDKKKPASDSDASKPQDDSGNTSDQGDKDKEDGN